MEFRAGRPCTIEKMRGRTGATRVCAYFFPVCLVLDELTMIVHIVGTAHDDRLPRMYRIRRLITGVVRMHLVNLQPDKSGVNKSIGSSP
jgi:hypothetical protein